MQRSRLWTRRMIRAGWLLGPVLEFPSKIFAFLFGSRTSTLWTLVCLAVILSVGSCTRETMRRDADATAEEIKAALNNDRCMIDLMPRRQADFNRPLTVRDLMKGNTDCREFEENQRKIAGQKAAMEALKVK